MNRVQSRVWHALHGYNLPAEDRHHLLSANTGSFSVGTHVMSLCGCLNIVGARAQILCYDARSHRRSRPWKLRFDVGLD